MRSLRVLLFPLCAWAASAVSLHAEQPSLETMIARARASVGDEATLESLRSVHYIGTVHLSAEAIAKGASPTAQIEIIFQKPCQSRTVVKTDKFTETTCIDDYLGWSLWQDAANPDNRRLTLPDRTQLKARRADIWENLLYYRGPQANGGELIDLGEVVIDGAPARKIIFRYSPKLEFIRYFNPDTGALVRTDTNASSNVREEGSQTVSGLRFPKSLITTTTPPKGEPQIITISIDQVIVNETFPSSTFEQPVLRPKVK